MYEQILKQADDMIKENVSQYRETFQKDISSFSLALKKEYETIKVATHNMLDGVADRIETTIVTKTNDSIEELKNKIDAINNKLAGLENKFNIELEEIKSDYKKNEDKVLALIKALCIEVDRLDAFDRNIDLAIKDYISKNSKQIKNELLKSFFK